MARLIDPMAALLVIGVLAWVLDVFRFLGLLFYTEQFLAGLLVLALPLVYLCYRARGGRSRSGPIPWYDGAAALLGFGLSTYVALRFPVLSELVATRPTDGIVVASLMCLLLIEGLRRTSGPALAVVTLFFFVLALVGHLLPDTLGGRKVPLERLTYFVFWDPSAIFGTAMHIVSTIVVSFVLFGNVLFKTGGSIWFTDLSMALMGRFRGGSAKIAILASSLFGTISGSVVANVVTTGVVTIPMMKKGGFRGEAAGAIEAVASTGGQLMPPIMGIAAFLMAEFLGISYASVAVAAIIPSVLYYMAVFIQTDLEAVRSHIARIPEQQIPKLMSVLRDGWYFPIPFAILIYTLFVLNFEPERSALWAAGSVMAMSLIFGFRGRRPGLAVSFEVLRDTGISVLELFMIGAAAGVVISTLNYSGQGFALTLSLVQLAGGSVFLLLVLSGIACIVLGMGMPTVGVYILLATLVAPALIEMKINPLAAHMFILYYGMLSMITPPVCIGAFAAANIAEARPMQTGWIAVKFGWVAFVIPFLFVYSPTLLMVGNPAQIAVDLTASLVGVWLLAMAIMGISFRPLLVRDRLYYLVAGLCLMLPVNSFSLAHAFNIVGLALVLALIVYEVAIRRKSSKSIS